VPWRGLTKSLPQLPILAMSSRTRALDNELELQFGFASVGGWPRTTLGQSSAVRALWHRPEDDLHRARGGHIQKLTLSSTYTPPPGRHSSAVEQLFRKQQVLGSNPSVGSTSPIRTPEEQPDSRDVGGSPAAGIPLWRSMAAAGDSRGGPRTLDARVLLEVRSH
jgi:hypothetical protein